MRACERTQEKVKEEASKKERESRYKLIIRSDRGCHGLCTTLPLSTFCLVMAGTAGTAHKTASAFVF